MEKTIPTNSTGTWAPARQRASAAASHNQLFTSMPDVGQYILTNDMEMLLIHQGTDIDSLFYHETIIDCIENRKPEKADFLMSQHLSAVISRLQLHQAEKQEGVV